MTQPTVPEIPDRYLKDGEFWGLTWNQQDQALRELAKAERELAEARAEVEMRGGILNMAVDRLSGTVEGNPTARHNFLQRIDELIAKEGDARSLADLLCPLHASLDEYGNLKPFDNCIACIRNQRDELETQVERLREASKLEKLACAIWAKEKCTTNFGIDIDVWETMLLQVKKTWLRLAKKQLAARSKGGK